MSDPQNLPDLSLDERICLLNMDSDAAVSFGAAGDEIHAGLLEKGLVKIDRRSGPGVLLSLTARGRMAARALQRACAPLPAAIGWTPKPRQ